MNTDSIIGLALVAIVLLLVVVGISQMIRPRDISSEEYERRAKEGSGIAGSLFGALQASVNPKAEEAAVVQRDMRAGYYNNQQKAEGDPNDTEPPVTKRNQSRVTSNE